MKNKNLSRRRFDISVNLAATNIAMIPIQVQKAHRPDAVGSGGTMSTKQGKPADGIYYVRDFGAKGDGTTLDSPAINKGIELCSSNGSGKSR
jgi:polygalacturonase